MGSVAILGGGVAGLAAASVLSDDNTDVTVFEQARELTDVGAGIQISPNGSVVLKSLGLTDALAERGTPIDQVTLFDGQSGRKITTMAPASGAAKTGYFALHRQDLIEILAQSADRAGATLETNRRALQISPSDCDVRVTIEKRQTMLADLVVAADGIHSIARRTLGDAPKPDFTGQVAWRAVIADPEPLSGVELYLGPGRHIVTYSLGHRGLRNIVAVNEQGTWAADDWTEPGNPDDMRAEFAGFCDKVQGFLSLVERVNLSGLHLYPTLNSWTGPRLVAIGDAAHPMLPFLAQGANMALEDAAILSTALKAHDDPREALRAFEKRRKQRAARVVAASLQNARNFHLSGGRASIARTILSVVGRVAPGIIQNRFRWLYDYDATQQVF